MKFFHLSDLHLGKRVNEFSMLEDQAYILSRILDLAGRERPEAVLIAGDVYDKPVPPAEAVGLFDDFLVELVRLGPKVFVVSGNHDSAERVAFGGRLLDRSGLFLSPVYTGRVEPVRLEDAWGPVKVWLLPFIKPAHVRRAFPEEPVDSYTGALRCAVAHMALDPKERNILVTHQFVTGASRRESEELNVGGADNVDAAVFDSFDYVALGHLHGPQSVGRESLRYCGSPLKYSFSEAEDEKSVACVELREKGELRVRTLPLRPLRDMRRLRGRYMDLTARTAYEGAKLDDYIHITLTDEEDVPDAAARLRVIYPNLMKLEYDNARTRSGVVLDSAGRVEERSPLALFGEFYEKVNGQAMSPEQAAFAGALIEEIWEERT